MKFISKFGIFVMAAVLTLAGFNLISNTFSTKRVNSNNAAETRITVHVSGFKILA